MNYGDYTTVEDVKNEMGIDSDAKDQQIATLIRDVSAEIDKLSNRFFHPLRETRLFDTPEDVGMLKFDRDLLAVEVLTNGDGAILTTSNYLLKPANLFPKSAASIKVSSNVFWALDSNSEREQVISLLGVWGYHTQYSANAWQTNATLAAAISSTTTTEFTTQKDKLKAGQLLKIDSEYLYASAAQVNSSDTETFTVVRGVNGTTAATHLISAAIYAWNPESSISRLAMESVIAAYRAKSNPAGETLVLEGKGYVIPKDVIAYMSDRLRALGLTKWR